MELDKGSVLAKKVPGSYFELGKSWAAGNAVHVEGRYALPAVRASRLEDVGYYLVLVKAATGSAVTSHKLIASPRNFGGEKVGDPLGDYRFTYFASALG